jgi:hypothetical protein
LNSLGFHWSSPMPSRSKNKQPRGTGPQKQSAEVTPNDEEKTKKER